MAWIKISEDNGGTYAREASPDPAEILSISELEERINWLNSQGVKDSPDQETLDFWNSYKGLSPFISEKEKLENLLNELKEL